MVKDFMFKIPVAVIIAKAGRVGIRYLIEIVCGWEKIKKENGRKVVISRKYIDLLSVLRKGTKETRRRRKKIKENRSLIDLRIFSRPKDPIRRINALDVAMISLFSVYIFKNK